VISPDAIVLVRGRLDHKDRGETKVVVQEAQRFEPDADEIARGNKSSPAVASGPFKVEVDPSRLDAGLVDELKAVLEHHKGDAEVHLVIETSEGSKSLRLGEEYKVRPSSSLLSEIDHVLGQAALAA
jgi:DNA polymerase-3 subunit alpha